jgi:predicted GH43/DUF377 family glycosyl hydrolase
LIHQSHDLIERWEGNPIIMPTDLSFPCLNILNAGAVVYKDETILLVRVETMKGQSVFVAGRSRDGIHFTIDDHPILAPAEEGEFAEFETEGVEDPRITLLEGNYYIVYTANSGHGCRLMLAKTKDFQSIERIALISEPDNKNGALFSKKIAGRYARLDRPLVGSRIWISYSKDLVHWGESDVLLSPRGGTYWDSARVGTAMPPIETKEGWLLIYYGAKNTGGGPIFRIGAALLDLKDPAQVIDRSDVPILSPREPYERIGDISNVIFSTGGVVNEKTGELVLYYGAANTAICMGTAKVADIIKRCKHEGERYA